MIRTFSAEGDRLSAYVLCLRA